MKQKDPNFKVPVTKILEINPHPNPEVINLQLAKVYDFDVIISKNSNFKVGSRIVYFPVNSILPHKLETFLFPPDCKIKLEKSRVKAAKIKKCVSYGLICPWEEVRELYSLPEFKDNTDLQDHLNVVKYYPPVRVLTPPKEGREPRVRNKVHENEYFKKYNGCTNLKWVPNVFEETDDVYITEKIHGCLQANTLITLWDGQKRRIKDIVNSKEEVVLLGFDKNNNPVPSKILNWFNNGVDKNWLSIKFDRTGLKSSGTLFHKIIVTPNHKFYFYDKKEYIEASYLKENDEISISRIEKTLSSEQKSVLLGKLLGDGSLINNSIQFGHKIEHEPYLLYTLACLGEIAGNQGKNVTSGYGTEMCRGRSKSFEIITKTFLPFYNENGVKIIPKSIVLDPISLAFWYMDDGSLTHTELQQDRANFAVCGFDKDSVDNLVFALKKLLNNEDVVAYEADGYNRIRLNKNAANIMFEMIRPYIPDIMQYKLPKNMRGDNVEPLIPEELNMIIVEKRRIFSIEKIDTSLFPKFNWSKFDLETETHNFVANNIIVHNSNLRVGWLPYEHKLSLWQKIKKFFGINLDIPTHEYCYGSNNVQRQNKSESETYYGTDVYARIIKNYNLKDISKRWPGYVFYGEIYGPTIQKGYGYGLKNDEIQFVLFDILEQKKDSERWLSYNEVADFCDLYGIPRVPLLYRGKWNKELAVNLAKGNSIFCPEQKVIEGVVVKHDNVFDLSRAKIKIINPEYTMKEATGETTDEQEIE
jgi:hypothetical protein